MEFILNILIMVLLVGTHFIQNNRIKEMEKREEKRHNDILLKLALKRENFKKLQEEIEQIKEREKMEYEYIKAMEVKPTIGFQSMSTTTVGDVLEKVDNYYKEHNVNITYTDLLNHIKIE